MKTIKILLAFLFCVCLFSESSLAQEYFLPMNRDIVNRYEPALNQVNNDFHTDIKPYRINDLKDHVDMDSVEIYYYFHPEKKRSLLGRKLQKESLIIINSDDFSATIDPVMEVQSTYDAANHRRVGVNTRGFNINASLGKKVSFSSSFYENQATYVNYMTDYVTKNSVIPGQGTYKGYPETGVLKKFFGDSALYDYAYATGYVSYTPNKTFNFQFGSDKNFIGDGYRSLLLSDAAFSYPFFKITTSFWHIKYVNLYTSMLDIRNPPNAAALAEAFDRKFVSMHYLSWNVSKRWTVGFFEAVVFRDRDSISRGGFEFNYLNPVIFLRPVEFSLGSSDNALMGFTQKFKISNSLSLYSQLMLDEFKLKEVLKSNGWHGNKQAFQMGLKYFNVAGLRNFNWQGEFNYVRPYMYSHYNTLQNYGHDNQSLGDPLGANFVEGISFLNYRYKRIFTELKYSYVIYGEDIPDTAGHTQNYGRDIYRTYFDRPHGDYGYYVGSGQKNVLTYLDVRVAYVVNPKTNLNIEAGITQRLQTNNVAGTLKNNMIYFGIRTSLTNHYYDF